MNKTQLATFSVRAILYLFGILAILLTVLPFLRLDNWWIRIGEFPRLQIAVVCLVVLILTLFFYKTFANYDFIFLFLLLFSTFYQFYCIVPYTPVYPIQVEQNREAKVRKDDKDFDLKCFY